MGVFHLREHHCDYCAYCCAMRKLLSICNEYAIEYCISFNASKPLSPVVLPNNFFANIDLLAPFLCQLFCWSLENGYVPPTLNGKLVLEKEEMCNLLNECFGSVFTSENSLNDLPDVKCFLIKIKVKC